MAINTQGPLLLRTSWAEFGVATALVLLRFYTVFFYRSDRSNRLAKIATYVAIGAWVPGTLNTIFTQLSVHNGMGKHIDDISPSTLPDALKYSWAADASSRISIGLGKLSVAVLLAAVQSGALKRWERLFLGFVPISNILINIVVVFTIFFQCNPPRKLWDDSVPGTCPIRKVDNYYGLFGTSWGAASDLALALYPVHVFWSLQTERKNKIAMSIIFSLGIFASVCAIVTSWQLHAIENTTDPSWYQTPLTLWALTEMWVVIVAASIPQTVPYFRDVARHFFGAGSKQSATGRSWFGSLSKSEAQEPRSHVDDNESQRQLRMPAQKSVHGRAEWISLNEDHDLP